MKAFKHIGFLLAVAFTLLLIAPGCEKDEVLVPATEEAQKQPGPQLQSTPVNADFEKTQSAEGSAKGMRDDDGRHPDDKDEDSGTGITDGDEDDGDNGDDGDGGAR